MRLPYYPAWGPINTWGGEYKVNSNVDLLSVTYRTEFTQRIVFVVVFNVGFWVSIVNRKRSKERAERMADRIRQMLKTSGGGD